jgi:cytochrome c oxidase subunit 3
MEGEKKVLNSKVLFTWLSVVSSTMIFAGLTSGYIVSQGDAARKWIIFSLPSYFLVSTIVVLLSSLTLYLAFRFVKDNEVGKAKIFLFSTILLALVFLLTQFLAYKELVENGLYLLTNVAVSFVYVISFMHALHIILGLIFLIITLVRAYQFRLHSQSTLSIKVTSIFWHFLSFLWLYLYAFLWYFGQSSNS